MEWERVIERNREGLRRVLVLLLALAGLDGGAGGAWGQFAFFPQKGGDADGLASAEKGKLSPARPLLLPRRVYRAVLRLLRPAESAARRLIVVAARGLCPRPRAARPVPVIAGRPRDPARPRAFPLFDPPRRIGPPRPAPARDTPRIVFFGPDARPPAPVRPPCLPDDPVDGRRLAARLAALSAVLDDLPRAARRFARRSLALAGRARRTPSGRRRLSPFRVGRPPGQRRHGREEVHDILSDLHFFAVEALDTS